MFLNIKMSAKSNKIELSEEFMAIWSDEPRQFYIRRNNNKVDRNRAHSNCSFASLK